MFELCNRCNLRYYAFLGVVFIFVSCQQEEAIIPIDMATLMEIPKGFPDLPTNEENEFSQARWELGKRLFFDPVMSIDTSLSCATCHNPELAFSDAVGFSLGVDQRIGTRNTPTLANVAYHPYFTREGGVPTLEMQVLVPIQEHNEFDYNIVLLAERLQKDTTYVQMSQIAYGRVPDPFVITRSIACFERSLLSGNSWYDQFINEQDAKALSTSAQRGMDLFFSDRTQCSSCHGGFNFTNYAFENNGLYEDYTDQGRFRLTGKPEDQALFKVPTLRNIALTAPYMHDGSIPTLAAVVEHYNTGGQTHINKSNRIQKLDLSETEKEDLIQFLYSLTDKTFIENPLFQKY